MRRHKPLNQRRLTRAQVADLIAAGAVRRPDLEDEPSLHYRPSRIYEIEGGRILRVFNEAEPRLGGKGDLYTLDAYRRFIAWARRVDEDVKAGRRSSASHWSFYSKLHADLPARTGELLEELGTRMGAPLEVSYSGLDPMSQHVEAIGVERAQREIYDHLVAFVGEVMRARVAGQWGLIDQGEPVPCVHAARCDVLMPVNVVYGEVQGVAPADLRRETANEVRRARTRGALS